MEHIIGLDLGQTNDFTALAVLERRPAQQNLQNGSRYAVRHLVRFPLATPYTTIVPAVARLANARGLACSAVVADQTGVGRAVVDMLHRAPLPAPLIPVTITGGNSVTVADDGSWHVPKKELVTALQVALLAGRLHVARQLSLAATLVEELLNFRVKITKAAHETFGA
jgi:hypothetical protein